MTLLQKFSIAYSLFAIGLSMGVLVAACNIAPPLASPHPVTVTDQGNCPAACGRLKALGCPEANPIDMHGQCHVDADCLGPDARPDPFQTCSAAGTCMETCTNFCVETEDNGVYLDPTCVANVMSCAEVNTCPMVTSTGTQGNSGRIVSPQ